MISFPRPGLTARLVAALVLMAVTVVVLDTALTRWAFQTRFLSYVNEQESEALERLAGRLGEIHAEFGGWEHLDDRRQLARLLRDSLLDPALEHGAEARVIRDGPRDPASDHTPGARRHSMRILMPRLHLTDAAGEVVIGSREPLPDGRRTTAVDVISDGRVVGRVAVAPVHILARESDRRFARDHTQTLWLIAALAILLASIVGYGLARYLLAPVRAVTRAARDLAAGHFEARLDVRRSDELGALARDFNVLAAGLEASRESRRRWLADVAHELRTPLSVLRAEIEAMRDGIRPADNAAMVALAAEAERLGHLVDDLHHLSLADAGALAYHFTEVDPLQLVRAAADRFRHRLERAGLTLELNLPASAPALFGDPERLDQLLANLLENALRYTNPPGPVRLTVTAGDDGIICQLDDGPPGVPAAEIPELFERFTRREASRSRADGGSGLGLAIARRIAEAHGGTLRGAPSPLGGLRLTAWLPLGGPRERA